MAVKIYQGEGNMPFSIKKNLVEWTMAGIKDNEDLTKDQVRVSNERAGILKVGRLSTKS